MPETAGREYEEMRPLPFPPARRKCPKKHQGSRPTTKNNNTPFNINESQKIIQHENHNSFSEKGNKAAGTRARKAAGEIKKLVTDYRKASVAESK